MRRILLVLIIALVVLVPAVARGAGASLYFSPGSGSFFVGSTFDVSIFVNTGGENINAVLVNVLFDPKKIQVASPTAGKSFIGVWISQPSFSNINGTMEFQGGIPTPGVNTTAGLVSTVTFRVIAPGETTVQLADTCKVLRNDSYGTNALTSRSRGVYTLLIPPPEGPKVFSPTHPDQNKWYKNNNPTFSWEHEEGVTDFSYSFDQDPIMVPDSISDGNFTSVSYSAVEDGIWFFHVKAKKAGTWGGASHYSVQIDSSAPASFTPKVEPAAETTQRQPLVFFSTTDALSGVDHYTLKHIDITKDSTEEASGFFQEVASPYKLPALEPGKYLVVIRAYDVAGNWREGTVKIQIFEGGFYVSWLGIHINQYLIPWWLIILILIIILLIVAFSLWKKGKNIEKKQREKLIAVEKRLSPDEKQNYTVKWQ